MSKDSEHTELYFAVDSINGSSDFESGDLVSTVTRVMVSQNRLYSDSEEVVALQVFSEVIEMEGKEVNVSSSYGSYCQISMWCVVLPQN